MPTAPNEGKRLDIDVDGRTYQRVPIRTRVVMAEDDLDAVLAEYATPHLRDGDLLFVTEKIVAITQGRSFPMDSIRPRRLAVLLSRYVVKTPHGIGLGMPETMEMALRECGTPRILLAAAVGAVGKALGRKGDFYRVAGPKARGIDGPTAGTIPPYNSQVVLAPAQPTKVARRLQAMFAPTAAVDVAVVDINDIGGNVLGSTLTPADDRRVERVLGDNPLGQGHQSTPLGVIREV